MESFLELLGQAPSWLMITLAAASTITGDFFAKYWSEHRRPIFFLAAILLYLLTGALYTPTLLKKGLIVTALLWTILATAGFIVLGAVVFKEHLSTIQVMGVILGVITVILLSIG